MANVTEEKFLDAQGQPVAGEQGYAIKRFKYTRLDRRACE
jgi:hypothetical protein